MYLDNNGSKTRSLGALEYFGLGPLAAEPSWALYQ
jgi:hypothetical protein